MPDNEPTPPITDEFPWSGGMTEYDDHHAQTCIHLLNADSEGMAKNDMARQILGTDPDNEPESPMTH